jgi:glutathione synthase/RimK-type ligase-like ATP-grasp enzyme
VILIISHAQDAHLSYVLPHLDDDALVIDPVRLAEGKSLDYKLVDGRMEVAYNAQSLRNVRSVWYRRPSPLSEVELAVPPKHLTYVRSAINRHTLALNHLLSDALWVSDFSSIVKANIKPLQLEYAAAIGFDVPDTLFASSAEAAEAFVDKQGTCIAKPQATELPEGVKLYAKVIHASGKHNFAGLRYDPYVLQQYIEPKAEYRVTVVDDKVFAAEITSNNQKGSGDFYRDWRTAYADGSFAAAAVDLPAKTAKACVGLVQKYGLKYGAIDLIQDKQGKIWFIEINPNGQWAFIEQSTRQPIGKAIADLLQRG